jgi:hypothetical protein
MAGLLERDLFLGIARALDCVERSSTAALVMGKDDSNHTVLLSFCTLVCTFLLNFRPLPTGLSRAPDHIHQAMAFAKELIKAASAIEMAGGLRISLSIGLHTGSAQVS